MTLTPPPFQSQLSIPIQANNFVPVQSAHLAVTATSGSIVFTLVPGTLRITAKITNRGSKGAYVAAGIGAATAAVSSATPTPTSGSSVVSTCDYVAAGAIITQDYPQGYNTFAAICAGSDSTDLEITVGYGQ